MRALLGALAVIVLLAGCGRPSGVSLDGKWLGTLVERGESTRVRLDLKDSGGRVSGKLTVVSETGQDVGKGMSFDLVNADVCGGRLKFVVPVAGKVDDDALSFDLKIAENSLRGRAREMRRGSRDLPVSFARQ